MADNILLSDTKSLNLNILENIYLVFYMMLDKSKNLISTGVLNIMKDSLTLIL